MDQFPLLGNWRHVLSYLLFASHTSQTSDSQECVQKYELLMLVEEDIFVG